MGPERDDVGDDLRGYAWKYDSGERRREAHAMRALVALPAAGRLDPLEVYLPRRRSARRSVGRRGAAELEIAEAGGGVV